MGKSSTQSAAKSSKIQNNKDSFPPGMATKMLNLLDSVEKLEQKFQPLISKPHHEALANRSPLDKAKFGLAEVYTINSLFYVLMKTSKEEIDSSLMEDYKLEMNRLREVQNSISEFESRSQRPRTNPQIAERIIRRGVKQPHSKDNRIAKKMKSEEGNSLEGDQ